MINKQNLWFITLFSLILVLGIYYISLGDEILTVDTSNATTSTVTSVEEDSIIVALQVGYDEEVMESVSTYQDILLSDTSTLEEKNDAYVALQEITSTKNECDKINTLIKDEFDLESFTKINSDTISITIASEEHDNTLANKIIRKVQELYEVQKYITVKFE